jgi:hypothetical protein
VERAGGGGWWAELGQAQLVGCCAEMVDGLKEKGNRVGKEKSLTILKRAQAIEFKFEFEFQQLKTMHQHECNK